ncbi:hypothetical protein E7747_08775 [Duncaniella dubosii]|uniref:Uncharacterized protein n=1 Tax=Duncaniella dubosii TaxID=2518971 RepID=A0A4P7W4I8_9BACT|nr:hypothetical protein [Duncaniella dubosii]QCD42370.1 hypothetical protein E7747_08775 [Duncaniella dubosii]
MKITKEEISPVDVRLTVAIEENDYKDDVTRNSKSLAAPTPSPDSARVTCPSANSNAVSANR